MNKKIEITCVQEENRKIFDEYKKLVPYFFNKLVSKNFISESDKEDILSSGYLALWQVILKHTGENNKSFRSYIYIKIRGALIDSLRKRSKTFQRNYVFAKRVKLIVEASNTSRSLVEKDYSLNSVFDNAYEYALKYSLIKTNDSNYLTKDSSEILSHSEKRTSINRNLLILSENERLIIKEHYLEDKAFVQICKEHPHLSKSWVSKIHKKAIRKLKEANIVNKDKSIRMQA